MPRVDGKPTIAEILIKSIIDEVDKSNVLDGQEVLTELRAKFGQEPSIDQIYDYVGFDKRKDKSWPVEEDCKSCDRHRNGPHRFSCSIGGKKQLVLNVTLRKI